MKKLFLMAASALTILSTHSIYSQSFYPNAGDTSCDEPCNECYCLYVHYQPCYYTTKRCIEEQVPCTRRCCRYVPRYYQVQRCRYVPQYYTDTYCRPEREYYDVEDCRTCKRVICEPQCRYIPRYYWKHVCGDACASAYPSYQGF